jgi:hypothetical protein
MSSTSEKCAICQKSLGNKNKSEVTTPCKHTFHRECAEQRLTKRKTNDCPICRKESALIDALTEKTRTASKQHDSAQSKTEKNVCILFLLTRRNQNI